MKEHLVWGSKLKRSAAAAAAAAGAVVAVAVAAVLLLGNAPSADTKQSAAAGQRAGANSRAAALTVTTVEVAPVDLARTITVDGSIFPWQEVIIAPEVGGYRVAEVNVDVGDTVKKGQELVRLSSGLLEAEVASKEAILKQREAELVNAQASLKRGRSLTATAALSAADLDQIESQAKAAEGALESAKADLETSRLRLRFTHVTAPDSGIITARTVTVGQVAQAGAEMMRLLRQSRVEWRGEVPEARLGELSAGQRVTVTTADRTTFEGKIRVVAPTVADQSRTGLVYVDLESDARLRPGMFARGEIEIGRGPALTLPLESVVSSDGYSYAFVLKRDHTVERRKIQTGAILGATIEVKDGLVPGDVVVAKGAGFLKDGDLVNVAEDAAQETRSTVPPSSADLKAAAGGGA
ncbi:MAG TPA: efflux RND transporter periplasmic adaptor subunit [Gammaproteobacteria bacterium]|nr:efflux RND transporter periplasmic adaptor subunit [Gammaproteobacteria bacterium]